MLQVRASCILLRQEMRTTQRWDVPACRWHRSQVKPSTQKETPLFFRNTYGSGYTYPMCPQLSDAGDRKCRMKNTNFFVALLIPLVVGKLFLQSSAHAQVTRGVFFLNSPEEGMVLLFRRKHAPRRNRCCRVRISGWGNIRSDTFLATVQPSYVATSLTTQRNPGIFTRVL